MTKNDAIKVRDFLTWVTSANDFYYYFFAARPRYKCIPNSDWEVCMYGPTSESSSLIRLAELASSLEWLRHEWSASVSSYNAATNGKDNRMCITIG